MTILSGSMYQEKWYSQKNKNPIFRKISNHAPPKKLLLMPAQIVRPGLMGYIYRKQQLLFFKAMQPFIQALAAA